MEPPYFSPCACKHHREQFLAIFLERGIRDLGAMERLRMLVWTEAGRVFSRQQLRQWLTDRCAMCDRGPWVVSVLNRLIDEEIALNGRR